MYLHSGLATGWWVITSLWRVTEDARLRCHSRFAPGRHCCPMHRAYTAGGEARPRH